MVNHSELDWDHIWDEKADRVIELGHDFIEDTMGGKFALSDFAEEVVLEASLLIQSRRRFKQKPW